MFNKLSLLTDIIQYIQRTLTLSNELIIINRQSDVTSGTFRWI